MYVLNSNDKCKFTDTSLPLWQGLGLFAARDIEKHTMVIEYIGQLIRNEVAEKREKLYEQQHRGIYMFRLTDDMGKHRGIYSV